ncbi:traB domain-containing protein-like isoform X2 [Tripterygium wilfordii]|uniref:traB domain-containing protein-like isoform X2 n=1 Tax=Tripterygium wilfordii TaxID=458696 RepID=UPI0018F836B7|nr:traB domain-containing protein-like isoform X2 [Tripterygium wilfordii]
MIRLIRLFRTLNSFVSRRFLTFSTVVPLRRVYNTPTFAPCIRLSYPQFGNAASLATKVGRDSLELTTPAGEQYVVVGYQGGGENVNSEQKGVLPEELARRVRVLTCDSTAEGAEGGKCEVYLIGTNHVYEVVFLELCSDRVSGLTRQKLEVPSMIKMVKILWKEKCAWFSILLSRFYVESGKKLGVYPGSEFRIAFEEARKYGGKVILGDRPFQITLRRAFTRMKLRHKAILHLVLLLGGFFLRIFSREDLMKEIAEMHDEYDHADEITLPHFMELFSKALIDERDQYMAFTLWRVARKHRSVVAVVGMGHLQGIKSHWKKHVEMNDLLEIPSPCYVCAIIPVIRVLARVAIIYGIYRLYKRRKNPSSLQENDFVDDVPL